MRRSTHYIPSKRDLRRPCDVYFIACDNRFVKVGFADNVETRLAELQTGCPFELKLLAVLRDTSMRTEQWFHQALRAHRVRGEWFELTAHVRLLVHYVAGGFYPMCAAEVEALFEGIDRPGVAEIAARYCRERPEGEQQTAPSDALLDTLDRVWNRRGSAPRS